MPSGAPEQRDVHGAAHCIVYRDRNGGGGGEEKNSSDGKRDLNESKTSSHIYTGMDGDE